MTLIVESWRSKQNDPYQQERFQAICCYQKVDELFSTIRKKVYRHHLKKSVIKSSKLEKRWKEKE